MEKMPITSEKRYIFHGYFDIKDTYNNVMDYLENSMIYDASVKDYEEVNSGGSRKIMSKVEAEKIYNEKYKIILKFEILMEGKDSEVKVNEKIKILCKGTAKLTLNAYIEPDWQGDREKGPLADFLGKIYDKFVGVDEFEKCQDYAATDIGLLISKFKDYMNATIK